MVSDIWVGSELGGLELKLEVMRHIWHRQAPRKSSSKFRLKHGQRALGIRGGTVGEGLFKVDIP